jgi:hypothetical protein
MGDQRVTHRLQPFDAAGSVRLRMPDPLVVKFVDGIQFGLGKGHRGRVDHRPAVAVGLDHRPGSDGILLPVKQGECPVELPVAVDDGLVSGDSDEFI